MEICSILSSIQRRRQQGQSAYKKLEPEPAWVLTQFLRYNFWEMVGAVFVHFGASGSTGSQTVALSDGRGDDLIAMLSAMDPQCDGAVPAALAGASAAVELFSIQWCC